ncbi:hypothetical protein O0L34_g8523 [Tuta absoluta]|nr:hypothetical protein O0L34_g8523 [Tuta absoluta]
MRDLVIFIYLLQVWYSNAEIGGSVMLNKKQLIKPVGGLIAQSFVPLTELPPPNRPEVHYHSGRRHFDPDCGKREPGKEVYEGAHVEIWGDYYEERFAKTVATVIFPDHIDHRFFEVTTQVPYFTVGPIDAIGYHPSTIKSDHPSECEKIYQDHIADQYTDESTDFSEESLEMARMPIYPPEGGPAPIGEIGEQNMYDDFSQRKKQLIKPVGGLIAQSFVPLTELPPPNRPEVHYHSGRRHFDPDCGKREPGKEVYEGAHVEIWGDYYEERFAKTVATVIFPDHIDHRFFEVTTQVPYFTVGPIDAIGYHPSTIKSDHPSECEKIYQDHIADQYTDESTDFSEESLEMARMPIYPPEGGPAPIGEIGEQNMYDDFSQRK